MMNAKETNGFEPENQNETETANNAIPTQEYEAQESDYSVNESVLLNNNSLNKPICSKYDHVDFSRFDRNKMFSVIVELIRENKILFQENQKINEEIRQSTQDIKNIRQSNSNISDKIDYIAQKICPSIIELINNGQKMTVDAKVATIISSVQNEKKKYIEQILALRQQIRNQKIVLDELKSQLAERIMQGNEAISSESREFTVKDFETFAGTSAPTNSEAVSINGTIAIKAISLEKSRQMVDDVGKKIIEGIGKDGLSEYPELLKYCLDANMGITESKFDTTIDNLKAASIIDIDLVQSVNRMRGVRLISLTNEVGKALFKDIFRSNPILSEKEKIRRENDNLNHGYSIKDVASQLEIFGYTDISMDRRKNTIPISGANVWIPDIIAINPISGLKEYFEVEMGGNSQESFSFKMDKANLKANVLKIIVPNKNIQENICRKIDTWKAQNPKKTHSITIFVQRFAEFKNKQDGKVYAPRDAVLKPSDVLKADELIKKETKKNDEKTNNTKRITNSVEDDV